MSTAEIKRPVVLFRMTSDQFCELPPSDRFKLELLDGDVIVSPRPRPNHQYFLLQLALALETWIKPRKLGRLLPDTLMKLDGKWTPAPDLVFVARKHLRRVKEKRIEGPVDLAVEIISPNNPEIDRDTKFGLYARNGIPWYWIVDLQQRQLDEYQRVGKSYGGERQLSFDESFAPRVFPGLTIDLASLEW